MRVVRGCYRKERNEFVNWEDYLRGIIEVGLEGDEVGSGEIC